VNGWPLDGARRALLCALALALLVGPASTSAAAQLTLTWVDGSAGVVSYIDTTVAAGTTYCYRVRAFNAAGTSDYSNEACGSAAASLTLTVSRAGTGAGTVTSQPPGITCGSDCSESYTAGTAVTVTAAPAAGSTFSGWSGGGCSGTAPCTVTGNSAIAVTATFAATTSNPPGAPSVEPIPSLTPGASFTVTITGMTDGVGASITNVGAASFWPPYDGTDGRPRNWNYKPAPTRNPETLTLEAPAAPGTYEIHIWHPNDDVAVPSATRTFVVGAVSGPPSGPPAGPSSVVSPNPVAPGAAFTVRITGMRDGVGASITNSGAGGPWPPYDGVDGRPRNWNFKLAPTGDPETLTLQAPTTPGNYEIHVWHPIDDVYVPSATTALVVSGAAR
jgi:hypothetical protein